MRGLLFAFPLFAVGIRVFSRPLFVWLHIAAWSVRVDVGAAAAWPSALSPKLVRNAFAERLKEHAFRLIHETLVAQATTAWGSVWSPLRAVGPGSFPRLRQGGGRACRGRHTRRHRERAWL